LPSRADARIVRAHLDDAATMPQNFDVIVVGLGAMGSAAAFHLARAGHKVLGLDRFTPPHRFGSSHGRTRIIRQAYFEDPLYVPMVQRAAMLWSQLEQLSGQVLMRRTGGLMIGPRDGVLVDGALRSALQHGLAHRLLSAAEVRRSYPALQPTDDMVAVWEPDAGMLFPEAIIDAHLSLARAARATLHFDEPVSGWRSDAGAVRVSGAQRDYHARWLLLCAGAWLPSLLPAVQPLLSVERQVMYWFTPIDRPALFTAEACPIHLWEVEPQRYFYGLPDVGDGVKIAMHHGGERCEAHTLRREVDPAEVQAIRAIAQRHVPLAAGTLRDAAVCMYTNTPDEHFRIGRHPQHAQVLVASACSGHGFKFASCIGEMLEQQVSGRESPFDSALLRWR
jgi:sarcosine oxidase